VLNRPEWKPWKSVIETFDNSLIPKTSSHSPTRERQNESSTSLSQRRKSFSSYHDLVSKDESKGIIIGRKSSDHGIDNVGVSYVRHESHSPVSITPRKWFVPVKNDMTQTRYRLSMMRHERDEMDEKSIHSAGLSLGGLNREKGM
jgi:hypothetical protein